MPAAEIESPLTDVEVALREMLTNLKKHGKKIQITIDEVTNNESIRAFTSAFQVLGYLTWNNSGKYQEVIPEYRQHLEEYIYEKIWSELSSKDKDIVYGIAKCQSRKVKEIREMLGIKNNEFIPYRKRIMKKGIVDGS